MTTAASPFLASPVQLVNKRSKSAEHLNLPIIAISAHHNSERFLDLAQRVQPQFIAISAENDYEAFRLSQTT